MQDACLRQIFHRILDNTNKLISACGEGEIAPVAEWELLLWFSLVIAMAVLGLPEEADYWEKPQAAPDSSVSRTLPSGPDPGPTARGMFSFSPGCAPRRGHTLSGLRAVRHDLHSLQADPALDALRGLQCCGYRRQAEGPCLEGGCLRLVKLGRAASLTPMTSASAVSGGSGCHAGGLQEHPRVRPRVAIHRRVCCGR
jgi:hypothetical protein